MATLSEVARRAGVSLATASRVLNGSAGRQVGEDLRLRVRAAAAELDYSPNAAAQAMARGRTGTVGLVVHDIADPYFAAIASGVMAAAAERDLLVTVASSECDPERELRHVESLRRQRAQAVVLAGSRTARPDLLEAMRAELRAISRDGGRVSAIGQDALDVATVVVENRLGAAALARSLYRLGHRDFTVLAGPPDLLTARDRAEGFALGLAEEGGTLGADRVVRCGFTRDDGRSATAELLAAGRLGGGASCVFAVNDVVALGALAALRDAGIDVPGEIAVAGFDDIPTLRDVRPGLTTVALPLADMGRSALELALECAGTARSDGRTPADRISVGGTVVLRESTALPAIR